MGTWKLTSNILLCIAVLCLCIANFYQEKSITLLREQIEQDRKFNNRCIKEIIEIDRAQNETISGLVSAHDGSHKTIGKIVELNGLMQTRLDMLQDRVPQEDPYKDDPWEDPNVKSGVAVPLDEHGNPLPQPEEYPYKDDPSQDPNVLSGNAEVSKDWKPDQEKKEQ